jgi:predicted permease
MSLRSPISRIVSQLRSWLRAVFRRTRLEEEMEDELACHFEILTRDLMRSGLSPAEAAHRARIALGPTLVHKEGMRASLGLRWWDAFWADLRYGARVLRKSPGFTAMAAISLALAIGANTSIFSVTKQLLYDRLNVPHAADLRLLAWTGSQEHLAVHHVWGDWSVLPDGQVTSSAFAYPVYAQLKTENRVLDGLFAFKRMGMIATIGENAQQVRTEMVSGNYFAELGVRPELGRAIEPSDDSVPGQGAVAVIGDALWERAFGRSPAVLGKTLKLDDITFTVVGVSPRGFTGARDMLQAVDFFVPLAMQPLVLPRSEKDSLFTDTRTWWLNIMGRAKPGVSGAQAQAALDTQLAAIVRAAMPVRPGENLPRMEVRDGSRGLFEQQEEYAKPMTVLMTMVGFVLLLACANVANLMLARGSRRQREMSVRMALGAGRGGIARQMLVESLLLAALGGAGGVLAGYLGANAIPKLVEHAWKRTDFHVRFDWWVFAFTAGVTLLTGTLFGLAPAFAAARANVSHGLKEGARTATRRRKGMGGKALVGFQIALSTLLVIGAGLFLRTLAGLNAVNVGFRTDRLLLAEIDPPRNRYPAGKDIELHRRLEQLYEAVPGVESVSPAQVAYVSDDVDSTDFLPQGEPYDKTRRQAEDYNLVGNDFFHTLDVPILAGRPFGPQDTLDSVKVGIINERLARTRFSGQDPVGKLFKTSLHDSDGHASTTGENWIRIVGVCGDTRYMNLSDPPPPQFYLPYVQQTEIGGMAYEIRTRMDPEALIPTLRSVVRQIDPDLPLVNVRTQDQQIAADLEGKRAIATLTSGFGLLALALAAVGIYGIMAYSVAQRTNEIGIRLALGAQPGQVRGMILGESAWLAVAGVVAGLAASLLMTHLVRSMLFGIQPYDPVTLFSGAVLLLAVALASSWIPARRAASIQPIEALRHE